MSPTGEPSVATGAQDDLLDRLDSLPRVRLAVLPTPLQEAPRLADLAGVDRLLVKRDDLTGLGMGGNKVRTLEYSVADALEAGADLLVGSAYVHSNHCRQLAAAGARLGIDVRLILRRKPGTPLEWQGNLLLDELFGAEIEFVDAPDVVALLALANERMESLRATGRRPSLLTLGPRSKLLGAVAAMRTLLEIRDQVAAEAEARTRIYVTSGGPTYAGLIAAARIVGYGGSIHGISNQSSTAEHQADVIGLLARIETLLDLSIPNRAPAIDIDDRFLGEGYGIPSEEGLEAIRVAARLDGLILDPIYTGKGMAGLLGHAVEGRLQSEDLVVFHHTGGVPAVFTYAEQLHSIAPEASLS